MPSTRTDPKLVRFRKRIEPLLKDKCSRPFVCSGSPYDCKIFIVGLNSATQLECPFFGTFWSDRTGCLRDNFEHVYQQIRNKRGVRSRLEAIVDGASPVPCLETNIYSIPTKKSSQLRAEDKDSSVFEALLDEIHPRVIFLHSNKPIDYFTKHDRDVGLWPDKTVRISLNGDQTYVLGLPRPLFRCRIDEAEKIGRSLRKTIGS